MGMAAMDQKNFALLSRKLEALSYTDPLDPVSAPLVQKLVDDLVHTTESYRGLKLRSAKQAQEAEQWQGKVQPAFTALQTETRIPVLLGASLPGTTDPPRLLICCLIIDRSWRPGRKTASDCSGRTTSSTCS